MVILYFLAVPYFLFSLLAVLPAPTYECWQLAVLATEWGYWFALLAGVAALVFWRRRRIAAVVFAVAGLLLLLPVLRAVSHDISLRTLLTGTGTEPVAPTQLTYTTGQRLDLYMPVGAPNPPVVMVIHGGSWRGGDEKQLPKLNWYLARRGYAVAAISYRLAPNHKFPAAIDDVRSAIKFLRAHGHRLGVDASRVVLLGRSAGGQLALVTAYATPDSSIKGAISLYGVTDLRWGWEHPANPRVINSREVLGSYLGGSPARLPSAYERASPVSYVQGAVPTLLVHGARDELVSPMHARMLDEKLRRAGKPVTYVELPWSTHGCDYAFNGPCGQITTRAIEAFLRTALQPS